MRALDAKITPREELEELYIAIAPKRQYRPSNNISLLKLNTNERLLMFYNGSARKKWLGGAYIGMC